MKILGNRVHLKEIPKPTVSAGGIHLAMTYQDDKKQWEIIGIGTGRRIPAELQLGMNVLTSLYFDHTTLDDGTKIVGVEQLEAFWTPEYSGQTPA